MKSRWQEKDGDEKKNRESFLVVSLIPLPFCYFKVGEAWFNSFSLEA